MRELVTVRRIFKVALLAGLVAPSWVAQQPYVQGGQVNREGNRWTKEFTCAVPTRPGGRLRMNTDIGSIVVTVGKDQEVTCRAKAVVRTADPRLGERLAQSFTLEAGPSDGGVILVSEFESSLSHRGSLGLNVEFSVAVPRRSNLELKSKVGGIQVETLDGSLRAITAAGGIVTGDISGTVVVQTAGGPIELGDIGNQVEARTAGGPIRVGAVQGNARLETSGGRIFGGVIDGTVHAKTAGGDIVLEGASGPVEAVTAGGQIQIGQSGASVQAVTAGGSIRLRRVQGRVNVETAGGSIDLLEVMGPIRASTVAGRILALVPQETKKFVASELENSMGTVIVYLPANLAVTVEANIEGATGHKIHSDFPLEVKQEPARPWPHTVRGRAVLNGGGEVLRIRTVAGDIEIRKINEKVLEEIKKRQEFLWKQMLEKEKQLQEQQKRRLIMLRRKPPND